MVSGQVVLTKNAREYIPVGLRRAIPGAPDFCEDHLTTHLHTLAVACRPLLMISWYPGQTSCAIHSCFSHNRPAHYLNRRRTGEAFQKSGAPGMARRSPTGTYLRGVFWKASPAL